MDKTYNLANFEAGFREFLESEHLSPVSLRNYLSDLRHFAGWSALFVPGSNQNIVSAFTVTHIEGYRAYLIESKIPLKTINRRLSTLRKACSHAINQALIKENPAKHVANVTEAPIPDRSASDEGNNTPLFQTSILDQVPPPPPTPVNPTELLSGFAADLENQGLARQDITNLRRDVEEFLSFLS